MINLQWRGPTDLTFHRLSRTNLLDQFKWIKDNSGKYSSSEIFRLDRLGRKQAIVKISEDKSTGVFLYPFDVSEPTSRAFIDMASLTGSDMKVMDFDEVYTSLGACTHEDVWLQFPDEDPVTVIGKTFSIISDGHLSVILTPVPKDIEAINEDARKRCEQKGCKMAKDGLQCGSCPGLATCYIIEEVNKEITQERQKIHEECD